MQNVIVRSKNVSTYAREMRVRWLLNLMRRKKANGCFEMSDEERAAQTKSFAYGNVAIDNSLITREMIDELFERMRYDDGKI